MKIDLLRTLIHLRIRLPTVILRCVLSLIVVLEIAVHRPRLHLIQNQCVFIIHLLFIFVVELALEIGGRSLVVVGSRVFRTSVLLVNGELAGVVVSLEVDLDLLRLATGLSVP